jgi:hypothetical protein
MDCKFVVGQKVTLIKPIEITVPELMPFTVAIPQVGEVYTVRSIFVNYGCVGICLVEIVCKILPIGFEPGWWHVYFRPAYDLTVFHQILAGAPVKTPKVPAKV